MEAKEIIKHKAAARQLLQQQHMPAGCQ